MRYNRRRKGENSELALSSPLSCVLPLHTSLCLSQATDPPGGLGAEENLLNSLVAGVDVSAAIQPLLPAAAAVDSLNSPCCFLVPCEQLLLFPLMKSLNSPCCFLVLCEHLLLFPLMKSLNSPCCFRVLCEQPLLSLPMLLAPNGLSPHSKPIVSTVRHRPGSE